MDDVKSPYNLCIFCGEDTDYSPTSRGKTLILCTKCLYCGRHYCITQHRYLLIPYPPFIPQDSARFDKYKEDCEKETNDSKIKYHDMPLIDAYLDE